ncbi:MAG TPA: C4-type zinc ribbon domain-containing protein [Sedimentisphaerales bacterium]|nr:C4-type zinc ribbon domain-containing protein [Sedimentisphaerales bacterium]
MGPVLNGLSKLQSVENRLRAAKAKLTRCRRNVVIQENQVRNLRNALEAKKEEIQLTQVQYDRLELELRSRDEDIAKLRAVLNTAKTNKEYAAVLTRLNTTKADNSKNETQILDLLKDIEADQAECKEIQTQIEEQKQLLEKTRAESTVLGGKYEAAIHEIQQEWNAAAKDIPAEHLEIFRRVAETYDGQAVAEIVSPDDKKKAHSCGGCFMKITFESVNLLMSKDEIIRCPNCTRILVLADFQG